eukprot:2864441-Prymnesium_polylepis.1
MVPARLRWLVVLLPASAALQFPWTRKSTVTRKVDHRKPNIRSEENDTANIRRKSHALQKRVPWALGDISTQWAS